MNQFLTQHKLLLCPFDNCPMMAVHFFIEGFGECAFCPYNVTQSWRVLWFAI
jgi:hypothetical protein